MVRFKNVYMRKRKSLAGFIRQSETLTDEDENKYKLSSTLLHDEENKDNSELEFEAQIEGAHLRLVPMLADGNCFFRALADQIEGEQNQHLKYRSMVVNYMMDHRSHFEPFYSEEDEQTSFEGYCEKMAEDGTWADHCELQAASMVTGTNIHVHRFKTESSKIYDFHGTNTHTIHLSYHNGNHYNSLHSINDNENTAEAPPVLLQEKNKSDQGSDQPECRDDGKTCGENIQSIKCLTECLDPLVPKKKKRSRNRKRQLCFQQSGSYTCV